MKKFSHLFKAGTSEGAEKAWESRARGIARSLAVANADHQAHQQRVANALTKLPDDYVIPHKKTQWKKQTLAGDVFWTDGKKHLTGSQLLEHLGGKEIAKHVGEKIVFG